jgi:hypothetical protein
MARILKTKNPTMGETRTAPDSAKRSQRLVDDDVTETALSGGRLGLSTAATLLRGARAGLLGWCPSR